MNPTSRCGPPEYCENKQKYKTIEVNIEKMKQ